MGFKKDFVWGAATAAYQIEGAHDEDGRGMSVWDIFSHQGGKAFDGHTGDIACDHYHRFREDVQLMKQLGIKAYRFSISWTRLLPCGAGEVNKAGLKFYNDLIEELVKNDIEPYITLFHWDYPYELYKRGGWLNPDSVKWFADYAALVVREFSDRATHYITFNEPQCFIGLGFLYGEHAPGIKCPHRDVFEMWHNVLKAHGAAATAMRAATRRPIKIGYAPTSTIPYPATDSAQDITAARKLYFECPPLENWTGGMTWWSDPIILGKYPEDGLIKYEKYLPKMTDEDLKLISQPMDFLGQNIYCGIKVKCGADGRAEFAKYEAGRPKNAMNWGIDPECLEWGPRFLYERYGLPIYITENGIAVNDVISLDGKVHDPARIDYVERHIRKLENAANAGADIAGYFHWSLMDNFEWARGYSERFGLVYVNYATQERIIKDSGYWYKNRIEKSGKNLADILLDNNSVKSYNY